MPNRRLTNEERTRANQLLLEVREQLKELSNDDTGLEWALRRYVYIRLQHDERGNPMQRRSYERIHGREYTTLMLFLRQSGPRTTALRITQRAITKTPNEVILTLTTSLH